MEKDAFNDLHIDDLTKFGAAEERVECSRCGRKRMYFCYSCVRYVNGLELVMPTVEVMSSLHQHAYILVPCVSPRVPI